MSKHTPGPWTFYADLPSTDPNWHIVTTENRMRVLANVHIKLGNEVDMANARLIAAAPDMYDVLTSIEAVIFGGNQDHFDLMFCVGSPMRNALCAAIAKAGPA